MDDEALVDGLMRRDFAAQQALLAKAEALAELLLRHFNGLDSGEVEDCVSETLYELIEKPQYINLAKSRKGQLWDLAYTMALNRARDRCRALFKSWVPGKRKDQVHPNAREDQTPPPQRQFISLERDGQELRQLQAGGALKKPQTEDEYPSLGQETGFTPPYPPEVVQAARGIIDRLKFSEQDLDHIRMRLVDQLEPKEIAHFLGVKDGNERTRWFRIMKKIEAEWIKYPALVRFGEQLNKGEILARATN